jgi:hypothetical protein
MLNYIDFILKKITNVSVVDIYYYLIQINPHLIDYF